MAVTYMERIPTVDFGYVEVEADTATDFAEGSAHLWDHVDALAETRAIKSLQKAELVPANPGLTGPAPESAPQQQWQPSTTPSCAHGPRKWVPGGVSKSSGKPYDGFWACQGPREQRCR